MILFKFKNAAVCKLAGNAMEDLEANLAENCIPKEFMNMDIFGYAMFLDMRRTLMAEYIRDYYRSLD